MADECGIIVVTIASGAICSRGHVRGQFYAWMVRGFGFVMRLHKGKPEGVLTGMVLHARCNDGSIKDEPLINESWTVEYEPCLYARVTKVTERLWLVNGVYFLCRVNDAEMCSSNMMKFLRDAADRKRKSGYLFDVAANAFGIVVDHVSGSLRTSRADLMVVYCDDDFRVLRRILREHQDWSGFLRPGNISSLWG